MASQKARKTILQKLEEYGDSYLDENKGNQKQANKNKRKEQKQQTENTTNSEINTEKNLPVIPRKKKKKSRKTIDLVKNRQTGDIVKDSKDAVVCKKMKWLKETLGSEMVDLSSESVKATSSVQTADVRKKEPEVIVFEDPTKKRRKDVAASTDTSSTKDLNLFDMKKARFEVRKLGISGFAREQKSEARMSLLLSLGAKPPKNKTYLNYKEFQQKRKAEIDAENSNTDQEGNSSAQRKEKTTKRSQKRSRDKNDVGDLDGQVGHYRNGVQFIGKDVIKKLKSS